MCLTYSEVSLQLCSFSQVSYFALTLPKGSDFFLETSDVIAESSSKQEAGVFVRIKTHGISSLLLASLSPS